jgi:hypothetical protein
MAKDIDPTLLETIWQAADWLLVDRLIDHPDDSEMTQACRQVLKERRNAGEPEDVHPSITEENTYTEAQMITPEFRSRVERVKSKLVCASLGLDDDLGVFWQAIHELTSDILLADKGEAHAAEYLRCLKMYEKWDFQQPLS